PHPPRAPALPYPTLFRSRSQASDGYRHAVLQIPVQPGLGTILLLKIVEELLGGGGKIQFLGRSAEGGPVGLDLLHGGSLAVGELDRKSTRLNSSHVSISY